MKKVNSRKFNKVIDDSYQTKRSLTESVKFDFTCGKKEGQQRVVSL